MLYDEIKKIKSGSKVVLRGADGMIYLVIFLMLQKEYPYSHEYSAAIQYIETDGVCVLVDIDKIYYVQ